MLDLIILAVITFFIVKKLKSILGKEGDDMYFYCYTTKRQEDIKEAEQVNKNDNTYDDLEHLTKEAKDNAKIIYSKIENFTLSKFQKIATKVLEYAIKANNERNETDIKKFFSTELAESICKTFENDKTSNIILVSYNDIKIIDILKENNTFSIKIMFNMEQINYTTDKNNNIIDGSKNKIINVKEAWTFVHNFSKKNNIWLISNIEELN